MDFAFSSIVFQHIPSREIIENYVREVHRLLRPGGAVQIPGAGRTGGGRHRTQLGGRVVFRRGGAEMAERCGFELRHQYGAGDQYYWLWFFKR